MRRSDISNSRFVRAWVAWVLIATALGNFCEPLSSQTGSAPAFVWADTLHGDDENALRWPVAVSSAANDELIVADARGNRLFIFQDKGGTVGFRLAKVLETVAPPLDITHDGRHYIMSLRQRGSLLIIERPQFQFRLLPISESVIPGALAAAESGSILLVDLANQSVVTLAPDGAIQSEALIGRFVTAVTHGFAGDFYTSTVDPPEIRRYGSDGSLLGSWAVPALGESPAWPVGLLIAAGGEMTVADRGSHRLLLLESGGQLAGTGSRKGWEPGLLQRPTGLSRFPDGRVAVADLGNGRVQIFRSLRPGPG